MAKYTPYEILFGRNVNILGYLQQRSVPLYNYDDLIHDIKTIVAVMSRNRQIQFNTNKTEKT
jgi:hypothetical protein